MKLVIDIPEEEYNECKNLFNMVYQEDYLNYNLNTALVMYIAKGTPIPKGHGRLIDAEELKKDYPNDEDWDYPVNTNSYVVKSIDNAPTIIEEDKGE